MMITPLFGILRAQQREWPGDVGASRTVAYQDRSPDMRAKSIPALTPEQEERFWSRVEVHQPSACWEWTGSRSGSGYGSFSLGARHGSFPAHRVAYAILLGRIDPNESLDHLCRNPSCVNPDHLESVSQRVNTLRGYGITSQNAKKDRCCAGHELTPNNLYIGPQGWRNCLTCKRERMYRYRHLATQAGDADGQ